MRRVAVTREPLSVRPSRIAMLLPAAAAAMLCACSSASVARSGAPEQARDSGRVPARDAFSGHLGQGSGSLRSEGGSARIYLHPGAGSTTRRVTIDFAGAPCHGRAHCVSLSGRLRGTITLQRGGIADAGRSYTVTARGRLTPMGRVRASGVVHGTGFVAQGRETLQLTLSGGRGSLTIHARSGPVRGFSSP